MNAEEIDPKAVSHDETEGFNFGIRKLTE